MPVDTFSRRTLAKALQDVLQEAAKDRCSRQEFVSDPCDPRWTTPAWRVFEREVMHVAVNGVRTRLGLPPVDLSKIDRVERQAAGHVDYCTKYPLYCAEIALGEDSPVA